MSRLLIWVVSIVLLAAVIAPEPTAEVVQAGLGNLGIFLDGWLR